MTYYGQPDCFFCKNTRFLYFLNFEDTLYSINAWDISSSYSSDRVTVMRLSVPSNFSISSRVEIPSTFPKGV